MIYRTMDDFWIGVIRQLLREGHEVESRVGKVKEGCAFAATLTHIEQTFLLNTRRKLSPVYGSAEFLWYLSMSNDIKMILAYAPQYHKFAEDDVAFGAYGYRMAHNAKANQLKMLIDVLTKSPNSRQAIITMWNANDLMHAIMKDHKDIPCTLSLQFLIRQSKLHLVVTMRSNDAWLGLPYDVFAFTCLQWLVASILGVEPGTYTHQAGSMHLYEKNWKAAGEALESNYPVEYQRLEHQWNYDIPADWQDDINRALNREQEIRTERRTCNLFPLNNMLHDTTACCAYKWNNTFVKPTSPILLKALENKEK